MKRLQLIAVAAMAAMAAMSAGCAAERISGPTPVSLNENLLRIQEEKPAGYPKHYVEDHGNYCIDVNEDWIKDKYRDYTMWRNTQQRMTIQCPGK